jgi:preprotein translocase subunit Sec63
MPRKSTKSHRKASPAIVRELRAEYVTLKRAYHKAGKAAFGKPANSKAKKEYAQVQRAYRTVGNKLGRATGIK